MRNTTAGTPPAGNNATAATFVTTTRIVSTKDSIGTAFSTVTSVGVISAIVATPSSGVTRAKVMATGFIADTDVAAVTAAMGAFE